MKTENLQFGARKETTYIYDIDGPNLVPPVVFGSANNRLMMEIVEDVATGIVQEQMSSGGGFGGFSDPTLDALSSGGTTSAFTIPETRTLFATKWYYYNDDGNVTRVVTKLVKDENGLPTTTHTAERMAYAFNQQAVAYAIGETWTWDGDPEHFTSDYATTRASQFRYDGARARYLVRTLDPANPWSGNAVNVLSDTWTDYDGDQPYGDFTVSGGVATNVRSYDLSMGQFDWSGGTPNHTTATYAHRDMIGTQRATSQGTTGTAGPIFTAFGELRLGPDARFGYVGRHGYQTDTTGESPFLHLGHRYYDPGSGRFLQRDPIGIRDDVNVYAYVRSSPQNAVDPSGLNLVGDLLIIVGGGLVTAGSFTYFVPLPPSLPTSGALGAAGGLLCAFGALINTVTNPPPIKVGPGRPGPMPPPTIGGGFIMIDLSKGT